MNAKETQEQRNVGAPTAYTPELAALLIERLSEGQSLRKACSTDDMVSKATVFRWLSESNVEDWAEGFRDQYARAKREATDAMAEELQEIAEDALQDVKEHAYEPKLGSALVQAHKLKADNMKWVMSKLKPKKYGEKVDVTSDGKRVVATPLIVSSIAARPTEGEDKQ